MAYSLTPASITSFDLTQQLLAEQTLLRLYKSPMARLKLKALIAGNQLLPRELIKITTSFKRHRIIELGCGNGYLTHALSLLCSGTEIIGIDSDEQAIQIAKETLNQNHSQASGNPTFICCDFNHLEKLDADLILINADSHLIQSQSVKQVFKQVQDWLEPGSDLIVKSDSSWLRRMKQGLSLFSSQTLKALLNNQISLTSLFTVSLQVSQLTSQLGVLGFNLLSEFKTPLNPVSQNGLASYQFTYAEKPLQPRQLESLFDLSMAALSRPVINTKPDPVSIPNAVTLKPSALEPAQHSQQIMPDVAALSQDLLKARQLSEKISTKDNPHLNTQEETLSFIFSKDWKPLLQELKI